MKEKCRHIPKNILSKSMICKYCGKRITYKSQYATPIMTFSVMIIASFIYNMILVDFVTNALSKLILLVLSSLISLLITFAIVILIGFKELEV